MSAVGVTLIGSVIFALHLNAVAFDVGLSIFGGIGNVNGNGYGSREHPSNYWFDFLLFYSTTGKQNRIRFCLFFCSAGIPRCDAAPCRALHGNPFGLTRFFPCRKCFRRGSRGDKFHIRLEIIRIEW